MNRVDIIQSCIDFIGANTYLEIGVRNGDSFLPIRCNNKIGVDVHINSFLHGKGNFYEMDSNSFFKYYPHNFDIAFIDGDHSYWQSMRDFMNCLVWKNYGGEIILHDCNPTSPEMASKEFGLSADWCGEVWKTIVTIRTKSYLDVKTFDCDFGVAVVQVKENKNRLNILHEDIEKMTYKDLERNRKEFLNLVSV